MITAEQARLMQEIANSSKQDRVQLYMINDLIKAAASKGESSVNISFDDLSESNFLKLKVFGYITECNQKECTIDWSNFNIQ